MLGAPLLADALQVLDIHEGPDSRGRYMVTCPECDDHGLRLDSDGAEKISATCPRRCMQVRINATIKKRIQAKGNGSSRHDVPEKASSSSKKPPTREGPGLPSWEATRWALRLNLKPSAKLVLIAYCDHSGEDGRPVYPSHGRICALTGLSRRHVVTLTGELVE
ncbi:MAG: helix-turn-helix domain-containing protein, partial [Actinomycetota bacterium]|nr:helix-turn-helix domain-containing protein [Actinomycetota bacterium]